MCVGLHVHVCLPCTITQPKPNALALLAGLYTVV